MDLFRFTNPTAPTKMEQAQIINGCTSKMWVERYDKDGEFTLVAPAEIGIKEKLPIGSFISHVNTTEIMIVENHAISDTPSGSSQITITGRGFETFFENRVVGSNKSFPVSGDPTDYYVAGNFSWLQILNLINDHILASQLVDDNDAIPYLAVIAPITGSSISIERTIPRGTLYQRLLEMLAIDNLGIKIIRPGPWSPLTAGSPNTAVVIHTGTDRTSTVIFSHDAGEIINADYLWSNKKFKNAALVTGKWVETVVVPAEVGYDRRWMYVNASDIDDAYDVAPVGAEITAVVAAMQQRGIEALASQNNVALTKAEVSKEAVKAVYRRDYDVGDLITVSGDYNEVSAMRVTEYVEIEDANGESGYPTLAVN